MTNPAMATSAAANAPLSAVIGAIATVTTVDTVTGVCSVDPGDGDIVDELLYLGAAPKVGAQVVLLTFRLTAIVLGGTG